MAKGFRGICGNVTMYLIVGLVMSTKQVCWAMAKILFAERGTRLNGFPAPALQSGKHNQLSSNHTDTYLERSFNLKMQKQIQQSSPGSGVKEPD